MARLLVPVDPTCAAPTNVPVAVQLALQLRLDVELLAVPGSLDPAGAAAALERLVDDVRAHGVDAGATVVDAESAAAAILRRASEPQIDLVCLTTRSRRGVLHAVWGSVAESVFARAAVPVAVVGQTAAPTDGPYQRVVACLDGTSAGVVGLRVASSLAGRLGAELEVVTVVGSAARLVSARPCDERLAAIASLVVPSVDDAHVLSGGDPAAVVAAHLRARPAKQLVVCGCRGRTGLRQVVGGSFTRGLVADAPVPVVVVPVGVVPEPATGSGCVGDADGLHLSRRL